MEPTSQHPSTAEAHEVHVWYVELDGRSWWDDGLARSLSPDERERAGRFHHAIHRDRWVRSRVALRHVLAGYFGVGPGEVRFQVGGHGKPGLDPRIHPSPVHFNVSRSDGSSVVAVTRAGPLGVDIERLRPIAGAERIAARFFASDEHRALAALPEAERDDAFLRLWTRKEAFVKALGEGLSHPLDRFRASLRPGGPDRLVPLHDSAHEAAHWRLHDLAPWDGRVGALALRADGPEVVRHLRWPPSVT